MPSNSKQYLNLGCGGHHHPEWVNIDFQSRSVDVIEHDLREGIPFASERFDVVYHSHVLEHFSRHDASFLIDECFRVMKPGGLLRVAVPDLEQIARCYLEQLQSTLEQPRQAELNYDWVVLELIDQCVRTSSGGAMGAYLSKHINKEFVRSRIGKEADAFWLRARTTSPQGVAFTRPRDWKRIGRKVRLEVVRIVLGALGGRALRDALDEGVFRQSGEVHRWMYDKFSLQRLLEASGFTDCQVRHAHESRIGDFARFELDIVRGRIRKPDSLFMEATRP